MDNSYLIILGAGPQQVDAYKTASRLGIKTLAVDYNPKALGRKLADKFLLASIKDQKECLDELKKLNLNYKGVIAPGVEVMLVTSRIAKEFGLISVSEKVAYNTTNKGARSTILQKAGIPIPKFEIIDGGSFPKMLFPLVVKPSDNSGSRGVRLVDSRKDWPAAYKEARSFSSDGRVIVEEFLQGEEVSIEGFVLNGKLFITGFSDRNFISGFHPYFMEDGSTYPTSLKPQVVAGGKRIFARAVKALGVHAGPTKGDLIVTKEGVKVLEVTSRFSPLFPIIMPLLTGIDHMEALIRWAVGMPVPESLLKPKFHKAMAHRYFFHTPGKITEIKGVKDLKNQPGVKKIIFLRDFKVGDILEPVSYINRLFYIVTIANDRDTAIGMAEKALDTVKIEVEPVNKEKRRRNVST